MNFFFRNKDDGTFKHLDFHYLENKNSDGTYVGGTSNSEEEDENNNNPNNSNRGAVAKQDLNPSDLHEAEVVHEVLVKLASRDAIRAKGAGENFTDQERDWIHMDKILNPEVYGLHKLADDVMNRDVRGDLSFNAVIPNRQLVEGGFIAPVDVNSDSHQRARRDPLAKKDPAMDGNIYQEQRWKYEDGEVVFENVWQCPFTRNQLITIRNMNDLNNATDDELRARRLLDKFYVSDNETIMGHARLRTMMNISKKITNFMADSSKEAILDDKHTRQERALIRGERAIVTDAEAFETAKELAELKAKMASEDGTNINRVWGGWDSVHPASGGEDSQSAYFLKSAFDPSRDHPASYGLHDDAYWIQKADALRALNGDVITKSLPQTASELQELSMATVKAAPGKAPAHQFDVHENDPSSDYMICDNTRELALMEVRRLKGKIVLLAIPEPLSIFTIQDSVLSARQSRAHKFDLPDRDDARILDITVSIVFQGNFADKGKRVLNEDCSDWIEWID